MSQGHEQDMRDVCYESATRLEADTEPTGQHFCF